MRLRRRGLEVRASDRWSACYAPHTAMYFDQFGKVRACCQNTGVYLGDVTRQTIDEIWTSAEAEHLRSSLDADDYGAGCEFCEWQLREGNADILFARGYDKLEPAERRPRWPRKLEFSMTNTCNLQCAMCNGNWSSTIRAKREGLPPIPAVYHDEFFDQLAAYLPHAEEIAFLGGEPFLGKEPLRVMEMLMELPSRPKVSITTNGTVFTDRVRRVVDALRPHIVVSIDGATPETYDAIRVGAHLPEVLANVDRFRELVGPREVSLTHCLMAANWHEFAALLELAEARDLHTYVNVVRFPSHLSLYQLPADELAEVVATLEATDVRLTASRLEMWEGHRAALAHRLEVLQTDDPTLGPGHGLPGAPGQRASGDGDGPTTDLWAPSPWPWLPFPVQATPGPPLPDPDADDVVAEVDLEGIVHVVSQGPGAPLDLRPFDGRVHDEVATFLAGTYGGGAAWSQEDGAMVARWRHQVERADAPPPVDVLVAPRRDAEGLLIGGRFLVRAARDA